MDPLVVGPDVAVEDLAKEFAQHHRVNPIPVVDKEKRLLGIVSRYDLIKFFNQKYLKRVMADSDHNGILQRLERVDSGVGSEIEDIKSTANIWFKVAIIAMAAALIMWLISSRYYF